MLGNLALLFCDLEIYMSIFLCVHLHFTLHKYLRKSGTPSMPDNLANLLRNRYQGSLSHWLENIGGNRLFPLFNEIIMAMQEDQNVFTLHAEKIESACVREREISGEENERL
jgi:hypothetical protein